MTKEKELDSSLNISIKNEFPPNYDKCVEVFGVNFDDGVIFTYGNTIYSKYPLSENKLVHEITHVKQHGTDPESWWDKYYVDKKFRLEQEIEAYKNETKYLNKNCKDRNLRFKIIRQNALDLSGEMYGGIISFNEALKLLI